MAGFEPGMASTSQLGRNLVNFLSLENGRCHECPLKKSILLESDVFPMKNRSFFRGHSLVFWVFNALYFTNLHCQIILGIGFSRFF